MKKRWVRQGAWVIAAILLGACAAPVQTSETKQETGEVAQSQQSETTAKDKRKPKDGDIRKFGIGMEISYAKSKDAEPDKGATAQEDTTIVAVALNGEGRIVDVKLDVAQHTLEFDQAGHIKTNVGDALKTKKEKGDMYGMRHVSGIKKEYDAQVEALEQWMIGKTPDEVMTMPVKTVDEQHTHVPDTPDLVSSVTIDVNAYQKALAKAVASAEEVSAAMLGLGINSTLKRSQVLQDGGNAQARFETAVAAVVLNEKREVVRTLIDESDNTVTFDRDGKRIEGQATVGQSKKELGAAYGMKHVSGIGKEWNEQIESYERWTEGKRLADILSMSTANKGEEGAPVPDSADLISSVTITVEPYQKVIDKAIGSIPMNR